MNIVRRAVLVPFVLASLTGMADDVSVLVKTEDDARIIGEVIARIIYGKNEADRQKPYMVNLIGDHWVVRGTQHQDKGGNIEIRINKFDGAVVDYIHGK